MLTALSSETGFDLCDVLVQDAGDDRKVAGGRVVRTSSTPLTMASSVTASIGAPSGT
ncbi:hypothetical protein [Streptomyces cacaoi]|uniref:hypothetical protein n=1 Tax=Streptomyces cacaoi TaxID=1898 RepID=UPI0037497E2F